MAPFLLGSSGYIVGGFAAMLLRLNKEQVQGRHGFHTTCSFWEDITIQTERQGPRVYNLF